MIVARPQIAKSTIKIYLYREAQANKRRELEQIAVALKPAVSLASAAEALNRRSSDP
jgi:hypothetical protein